MQKSILETWKRYIETPAIYKYGFRGVYEEKPQEIDTTDFLKRREIYGNEVPEGVLFLTCAVDVQNNRLEWEVVGWGADEEQWSIDRGVIFSDPKSYVRLGRL